MVDGDVVDGNAGVAMVADDGLIIDGEGDSFVGVDFNAPNVAPVGDGGQIVLELSDEEGGAVDGSPDGNVVCELGERDVWWG